jgi:hypothetical protein
MLYLLSYYLFQLANASHDDPSTIIFNKAVLGQVRRGHGKIEMAAKDFQPTKLSNIHSEFGAGLCSINPDNFQIFFLPCTG